MQLFLLCAFFLFYHPSKKTTQSIQFEVWMYFLISILLPFILYSVSSFSLILKNPIQYIFHLLIIITLPTALFLGLLSFRYFSWMSILSFSFLITRYLSRTITNLESSFSSSTYHYIIYSSNYIHSFIILSTFHSLH